MKLFFFITIVFLATLLAVTDGAKKKKKGKDVSIRRDFNSTSEWRDDLEQRLTSGLEVFEANRNTKIPLWRGITLTRSIFRSGTLTSNLASIKTKEAKKKLKYNNSATRKMLKQIEKDLDSLKSFYFMNVTESVCTLKGGKKTFPCSEVVDNRDKEVEKPGAGEEEEEEEEEEDDDEDDDDDDDQDAAEAEEVEGKKKSKKSDSKKGDSKEGDSKESKDGDSKETKEGDSKEEKKDS